MYGRLDPDTREIVWQTRVGPGGFNSGLIWGTWNNKLFAFALATPSGAEPRVAK